MAEGIIRAIYKIPTSNLYPPPKNVKKNRILPITYFGHLALMTFTLSERLIPKGPNFLTRKYYISTSMVYGLLQGLPKQTLSPKYFEQCCLSK